MASHRTYTATLHHMVLQSVINTSTVHICYNFFFLRILLKVNVSIKSKWVTDVLSSEDIRKVENKGVRGEQCPSVLYLHIGCCSAVLLAVQRLRVCPGCDVCQWFCTFGLGSAPGYPPAGNCVPLSCLLLGLFWFFFFWFLIFSWCRLCWQPMTAGEKKKIKTQKEKNQKQNPRGKEWRGSHCLGGSWNLLQSMNCSPKERCWLAGRALFSVFPTSVYIFGFKFAWILTSFLNV